MTIILASSSPQRKKILENLGVDFKAIPADIDEHHDNLVRPHAIVQSIARRKAEAVAEQFSDDWVIGCDTIVVLKDGRISLKPKNKTEARKILQSYQGGRCDVYSGLALVNLNQKKFLIGFERTRLFFKEFLDESLEAYLNTHEHEWRNSSGALTIEGRSEWIKTMKGDYWNVVGLPVKLLKKQMKEAGVSEK